MNQDSAQADSTLLATSTPSPREAERSAAAVLRAIAADAVDAPRDYLAETEVPEGGE